MGRLKYALYIEKLLLPKTFYPESEYGNNIYKIGMLRMVRGDVKNNLVILLFIAFHGMSLKTVIRKYFKLG